MPHVGALPTMPYTFTTTHDGIQYEVHPLTDVHQVLTEDGIRLCDVLNRLATKNELKDEIKKISPDCPWFRFKGVLRDLPDIKAIDQLFAKTSPLTGEVWLVEVTPPITDDAPPEKIIKIFDMYVYSTVESGWVFIGSTQRQDTLNNDVLKLFPTELGKPGQYLVVNEDGTSLTWGYGGENPDEPLTFGQHNADPDAHPALRAAIDLKADKLLIFNDVLSKDAWTWDGENPYFTYIYKSKNLPTGTYFEMIPAVDNQEDLNVIAAANVLPSYRIVDSDAGAYAILRSKHVPEMDIPICVKSYGKYETKNEDSNVGVSDPMPETTESQIQEKELNANA